MAGKFPSNSMHNRAKMIVMNKHFPEYKKGFVDYVAEHKYNGKINDFAELVGRHSVFGRAISDYLKEQGILDTVNNIVHELVHSQKNIDATRDKYEKIDYHLKTNKTYANRKLFETFVEAATPPEIISSLREDGTTAKRAMVALGEFLGVGNDLTKSAVFATILDGTRKEAFKRRNKAIDSQRIMAGQDLLIANELAQDTLDVAEERNLPVAEQALAKFKKIAKNAKNALAACALMSISALSATSPAPDSPELDSLLQKANTVELVRESRENPFSTVSALEMERLAHNHDHLLAYSGHETDPVELESFMKDVNGDNVSPIQIEMENEQYNQREASIANTVAGGVFVVEAGDTLSGIADNILTEVYGDYLAALTFAEYQGEIQSVVNSLAATNGIDNPDLIFPDQAIKVPEQFKRAIEKPLDNRIDDLADKLSDNQPSQSKLKMR